MPRAPPPLLTRASGGEAGGARHHAHAVVVQRHRVDLRRAGGRRNEAAAQHTGQFGCSTRPAGDQPRPPNASRCTGDGPAATPLWRPRAGGAWHGRPAPRSAAQPAAAAASGLEVGDAQPQLTSDLLLHPRASTHHACQSRAACTPYRTCCAMPAVAATLPKSRVALPMVAGGFWAFVRSGAWRLGVSGSSARVLASWLCNQCAVACIDINLKGKCC